MFRQLGATVSVRAILLSLILAGGLGVFVVSQAGQEVTIDGVVHVKNGSTPSQGQQTLKLTEQWRVGGEDDESTLFGVVTQARVGADGNIYLLDTQLGQIDVYSPDGKLVKTLSRQGEGPGEVNFPLDFFFLPDNTVGILQTFPGKIVKVSLDGIPAGDVTVGGSDPGNAGLIALLDGNARGGQLVLGGVSILQVPPASQKRTSFLSSYTLDGQEKQRYFEGSLEMNFANFDFHEKDQYFPAPRRWTVDADGRVYLPPVRDEYSINIYSSDGKLERVIEREMQIPKRSEARMKIYTAARDAQLKQFGANAKIGLCDAEPAVASIRVAEDKSIWVLHAGSTVGQPAGIMQTYDVFDPRGNLIKQVSIACNGDGENDALIFLGSDRLIHVTGLIQAAMAMQGSLSGASAEEEAPPMEIVCYRIAS